MAQEPSPREHISLFGNFGTLNIGNEYTLQAIILNIREYRPRAEIHCICSNPEDVEARHGIPAYPISLRHRRTTVQGEAARPRLNLVSILRGVFLRFIGELRDLFRIRQILKDQDMLIMTGTGMLADIMEGPFGLPYEIFKWILIAKCGRVRVLFVSVGVGPLRYRLGRWFAKWSLCAADYVGFRDVGCRAYMADLGFHKSSHVFPDLAFSLPPSLFPIPSLMAPGKPVIGVGLYDYCGRGAGSPAARQSYRDYLTKIGDFIAWLVARGYPVRILIGDIAYDSAVRDDLRRSLQERGIDASQHRILDEPILAISDLLRQIGSTDIVVASRFHNLILSLILAKPVIAISYHDKIDRLMADVGLLKYCVDISDFNVSGLIDRIADIHGHVHDIPQGIREKTSAYRQALGEQYRLIFPQKRTGHHLQVGP
jgi:polysaccharide pyruvyl transferase WcaK-like protein